MKQKVIDWLASYALYLVVVGLFGGFALFVMTVNWISHGVERRDCRVTATKMNVPWDYSPQTGCMVMVDHQWIPLGNVRKEIR